MTGNRTRTNFFKNKMRPGEGLENRKKGYGDILGDDSDSGGDSDIRSDGNAYSGEDDSGELQEGAEEDDSEPNDF